MFAPTISLCSLQSISLQPGLASKSRKTERCSLWPPGLCFITSSLKLEAVSELCQRPRECASSRWWSVYGGGGGGRYSSSPYHVKRGPGISSLGSLLFNIRLSVAGLFFNPFPALAGRTIIFIVCLLLGLLVIFSFSFLLRGTAFNHNNNNG
jgi:hypothetical protein